MNQEQAGEILRANVKNLSEPLKSAVEFTLTNFYQPPSASELAKNFLANLPSMTTEDAELKSRIDAAYFTLQNDTDIWYSSKDLPQEKWHDVVEYEGLYQVSNFGRVKSFKRNAPTILKGSINDDGYSIVVLSKNNVKKTSRVHILVAQAFITNPENKPVVNHIDGNKLNNFVSNLEWATYSENMKHAYDIGLRKSGCEKHNAKFTAEQVKYIREVCVPHDEKFSFSALAEKLNCGAQTIFRIVNGHTYKNVT